MAVFVELCGFGRSEEFGPFDYAKIEDNKIYVAPGPIVVLAEYIHSQDEPGEWYPVEQVGKTIAYPMAIIRATYLEGTKRNMRSLKESIERFAFEKVTIGASEFDFCVVCGWDVTDDHPHDARDCWVPLALRESPH